MSALTRIARLSAAFLGSNLIRGAIAFGLSLLVGRALGVERFGRWILCSTWASTLTIAADLGLGLLLPRDGARPGIDHGRLCSSALALRLTVALPAAAALVAAGGLLGAEPETIRGLRLAALLGAAGAAYGCFGATFRSQPRCVTPVLVIETAWHAVQLAASWILLRVWGVGVAGLLWIAIGVQLAQIASALALWRTAFDGEPIGVPSRFATWDTFRRAIPFAAGGIVANLQTRVAPLMLGYLSTEAELGGFAAAARFATTARLAPGAVFAGALPVLSGEHDRGADDSDRAFASFDRALAALAIATALPCVLLARPLLRIAYGPAFAGAAPTLMAIGLGLVPALTNSATKIALYAVGEETAATTWSAISLAIQVGLGVLLMRRFGGVGAATALAVGEAAIWVPLRRARKSARSARPSSQHREPGPMFAPLTTGAPGAPDRAAAR